MDSSGKLIEQLLTAVKRAEQETAPGTQTDPDETQAILISPDASTSRASVQPATATQPKQRRN